MRGLEEIVAANNAAVEKHTHTKAADPVDQIIAYESGDMPPEQMPAFFQSLIDSGLAWRLQGSYGRMAAALIQSGQCHEKKGG